MSGALLRQPGGFEGPRTIDVVVNPHDLPGTQREELGELDAHFDPAGCAATALSEDGEHSVPAVEELGDLHFPLVELERRKPIGHELPNLVIAGIDAIAGDPRRRHVPDDLRGPESAD